MHRSKEPQERLQFETKLTMKYTSGSWQLCRKQNIFLALCLCLIFLRPFTVVWNPGFCNKISLSSLHKLHLQLIESSHPHILTAKVQEILHAGTQVVQKTSSQLNTMTLMFTDWTKSASSSGFVICVHLSRNSSFPGDSLLQVDF